MGDNEKKKTEFFRQMIKQSEPKINELIERINPKINYNESHINLENNFYLLIETPLFEIFPKKEIETKKKKKIDELLEESEIIIWLIDKINNKTIELSKYLKNFLKPKIIISLSKFEETFFISQITEPKFLFFSTKILEIKKIKEKIVSLIPSPFYNIKKKEETNLIIFGPPNSGKSTLMNVLLNKKRSLVSSTAGTTKELVIGKWTWRDVNFQLIDTKGIETKSEEKILGNLLIKCHLSWIIIDVNQQLTKKIIRMFFLAEKQKRPFFIIINKSDLIKKKERKKKIDKILFHIKHLKHYPIFFISSLKKIGINNLKKHLKNFLEEKEKKIKKEEIENATKEMFLHNSPAFLNKKKNKIFFSNYNLDFTHNFFFSTNNIKLVHFSYQRYMSNFLRKKFGIKYIPIKLSIKKTV